MAKKKIVSHFERMTTPLESRKRLSDNTYAIYDTEDTVVNGKVLKKSVVRNVVPTEQFRGFKASDFALENIIAAGALDQLKPVQLHDDSLDAVDMTNGTLDSIMNQIDAQAQIEAQAPKNNDEE